MKKQRCIIIGSGLGGLSSGYILARNGYDVTILEQGNQIGGCLQCFSRKGVKFETGMHFIGSADKGETLYNLLNYMDINKNIQLSRLDQSCYDIISLQGEHFRFANGREPFINQMAEYFPKEKDNLTRYYDLINKIAEASSLHSLKKEGTDITTSTKYQIISVNEVLDSIIDDQMLRNVLVGNIPLYSAERDKTPFSSHAFIMDFYNRSSFRIVGGSDQVAQSLATFIESTGGQILKRHKVTKIECNATHAIGVRTENGQFFPADFVISDAHPVRTLEMLDSKLIRPAFRNRINGLRNSTAGFTVYLHFKKDTVPYMNSNFYGYKNPTPWDCEIYDGTSWPKGYLYMHFCHENNPKFAESGVILSYMSMDEVRQWENSSIGRRGDEYEQFKIRKAEKLIDLVQKEHPALGGCIENYYTSTPLTYRDYTGTQDGSMYGIAKDVTVGVSYRVPFKTKVPNLLLTGQNINSHGMLGVFVGTIVTCSELLGSEFLFNQIVEANR